MAESDRTEDRPEYAWLREFKATRGDELRRRYGAHGIGIGWKKVAGVKTDQLALIFYVERRPPADKLAKEPVPATIEFTPADSDQPVLLMTDVVETPPAEFE